MTRSPVVVSPRPPVGDCELERRVISPEWRAVLPSRSSIIRPERLWEVMHTRPQRLVPPPPYRWAREALSVTAKALSRLWGRDVMLYTGGVSFYAMLAAFPTLAIVIGVYSLLLTPQ